MAQLLCIIVVPWDEVTSLQTCSENHIVKGPEIESGLQTMNALWFPFMFGLPSIAL